MNAGPNTALVVIDAQRAFVDPEGSVARTFGIDDVQPGVAALGRLCRFEHRGKACAIQRLAQVVIHAGL